MEPSSYGEGCVILKPLRGNEHVQTIADALLQGNRNFGCLSATFRKNGWTRIAQRLR